LEKLYRAALFTWNALDEFIEAKRKLLFTLGVLICTWGKLKFADCLIECISDRLIEQIDTIIRAIEALDSMSCDFHSLSELTIHQHPSS
jgi:hypothetical protein